MLYFCIHEVDLFSGFVIWSIIPADKLFEDFLPEIYIYLREPVIKYKTPFNRGSYQKILSAT